ncbi:ZN252 protein, partial [Eurystomus gularis]|nr:ZN252 protein [Eurystomus gularis]
LHTREQPYKWDKCGKNFRSSAHLVSHQILESGKRNFKCSTCGKDFKQAVSLKQHLKTHEAHEPHC